jgi:RimJ/RimL family protein N-acetyltransferase
MVGMSELVETDRLVATRPDVGDVQTLAALWDDDRVTSWLGGKRTREQVEALVARWQAHWGDHGFGPFVLRDRATDEVVGWCGLQWTTVAGERAIELLYGIDADRWGEGLTTEAARRMVAVADDVLGLDELVAFTLTTNRASQRVMEKSGFTYEREITHADLPHVLYRRSRPTAG